MCTRISITWTLFLVLACSLGHAQKTYLDRIEEYHQLANQKGEQGQFVQAIDWRQKALDLLWDQQPTPWSDIVQTSSSIGRYYRKLGNFDSCYAYYSQALHYGRQQLAPTDPALLEVINSLGIYYYIHGSCDTALVYYQEVLGGWMATQGPNDPKVANVYNNMGICFGQQGNHERASDCYESALAIRWNYYGDCDPAVAASFLNLGVNQHEMANYTQALIYYHKALEISKEVLEPDHADFALIYNNMGVCYKMKADYHRAQELLEQAVTINILRNGPQHPEVAAAYNNLGLNFYETGDYTRALQYFNKALQIRLETFGEQHYLVGSLYNNIGNCHRKRKNFDRAYWFCNRALVIRQEELGEQHWEVADSYNDLGLYFEATNDYSTALQYYQQANIIFSKTLGEESHYTADSHERIGHCYFQNKDYRAAIREFTYSLKLKEKILGDRHPEVADLYVKLAKCYPDRPMQSLDLCGQSLQRMGLQPEKMTRIPTDIRAPLTILNAFETRGEILLQQFRSSEKSSWLKQAERNNQLALQVIDYARKMYQEPGSKQLLLASYARLFEQGIDIQFEMYQRTKGAVYLDRAFALAESSKNVALLEASQAAKTRVYSNAPLSIQQRERDLSIDINYLENAQFTLEKESTADKAIRLRDLQNQIFDLKQRYFTLIDSIQQLYPEYYQMRYGAPKIGLEDLRRNTLSDEETLLEYFVGDRHIYLFVAAPEEHQLLRVSGDFPLSQRIREVRNQIKSPQKGLLPTPEQLNAYAYLTGQLYEYLLAPAQDLLRTPHLIIVPDGVLGYLPFEALTLPSNREIRSWKDFHYLLEEYTISYSYAASLIRAPSPPTPLPFEQEMVVLAPTFEGSSSEKRSPEFLPKLPALTHNQAEAEAIGEITKGIVLSGAKASEANFLKLSGNSRMLHLATHAQANDSIGLQSYLAFTPMPDSIENELLFVRDLYNLHIPAELVVLSACETGLGQFQKGEGIISLGRGFLYAGAKSIVTTLWSIDDRSTSEIMEDFYRQMKEGKRKDEALRQAKINYLRKSSGIRAHPLFWAAYIPVGDMAPIQLATPSSRWHWWLSALLPVLIIARLSARKEGTRFFFF